MTLRFDDFEFDPAGFELRRSGARVELEPQVLRLLAYLLARPHRLVSKEELLRELWEGRVVGESSLTRCVSSLRTALGDSRRESRVVETVHGLGYRLVAEVRGEPGGGARSLGGGGNRPFVGRREVLAQLEAAVTEAMAGRGRLVLVSGPPGIGKSRTVDRVGHWAGGQAVRLRAGLCREELGAPPLWPWVQIFRQELDDLGGVRMVDLLGSEGPDVARLIPELRTVDPALDERPGEDANEVRFRLFDSAWRYLRRASRQGPRMLVLEDLHCADPSSLAILRFAAAELHKTAMLCVATFREAEMHADPARRAQLSAIVREPATELITLDGLSSEEVAELASVFVGRAVTRAVGERLRSYTGGNPFFLQQILPNLAGHTDGDLAERFPPLPDGVRSALLHEIDDLEADVRRVLDVASVVGREFSVVSLAAIAEAEGKTVLARLQPAIANRLIEESGEGRGRYRFVHELVRETLYEAMTQLDRQRVHLQTAQTLEASSPAGAGPHLAELAHHFMRATSLGATAKAIHYACAAGLWAFERMSYEEAARGFRAALELLDRDATRSAFCCDLLIGLTEAEARSGARSAAAETGLRAAEVARDLGDPERLARAALAVSPGFFALETGNFDPRLASLLESATATLEPGDQAAWELQTRLLGRLACCLYWSGRTDQIERVNAAAREAARRAGTDEAAGHALAAEHAAYGVPGRASRRLSIADAIVAHAERCADPEQALMGRVFRMTALLELGRTGEYEREISRFDQIAQRHRQPQSYWYTKMYRAARKLMVGRFDEAERLAQEYLALGQRIDDRNVFHCFAAHSLSARLERSLGDEVIPAVEAHAERYPEYPAWRVALVWSSAETGHVDQANRLLDEMMEDGFDHLPRDINWLCSIGLLVYAAWILRADRHAERLYAALEPYGEQFVTSGFGMIYFGSVEGCLARLAALRRARGEARARFDRAIAKERGVQAQAWLVRTQECLAEALLDFGDARAARNVARQTVSLARQLGMTRVAGRLGVRIAAAG